MAAVGGLSAAAACAAAAQTDGVRIEPQEPGTPWVAILYALVGAAGIGAVAFKSAKRSHLD
jgi:hypothetical protein